MFGGHQTFQNQLTNFRQQSRQKAIQHAVKTGGSIVHGFLRKNNIVDQYPMVTKTKTYTKKRNYRRKKTYYRKKGRKVATLWPQQKLVKFKVCQSYAPTAAGSTSADVIILKANDLNDPTGVAGASLPLGLDQWASMYSKYAVLGSKCTVQYHGETTNTGSTLVGINLLRDSTGLTQLEHYKEMPYGVDHLISPDNDRGRLNATYSLKKYDKIFKTKTAEDYHGSFTTTPGSPNEIRYWHLWYQDADKTQTCAMEFVITIEYIVLLFESITPSRSSL